MNKFLISFFARSEQVKKYYVKWFWPFLRYTVELENKMDLILSVENLPAEETEISLKLKRSDTDLL